MPALSAPPLSCPNCHTAVEKNAVRCRRCGVELIATASLPPLPIPEGVSLESSVRDISSGDVLEDTYRVLRKLGEGGMASVFLARDLKLDREVAVKVLARHLCEDTPAVARFEREARITARLDHPHIVPVYAVGRFHARPYMVMKYLDGESLAELLKRNKGAWSWAQVRPIIEPLSWGLGYLHERKLIHRDVKPSNVYVSPTGHVTLLDFGVLKETSKDYTGTGLMLGTLRFMAPEQLTEASQVDARADVYALGVMLYRLLAGRTPFEGDDLTVAQKKLVEDAPSADSINPTLSLAVAQVLLKAVSRDRGKRFGSATELLVALDAAHDGSKAPRRRGLPRGWLAAPLVLVALLGLSALAFRARTTPDLSRVVPAPVSEAVKPPPPVEAAPPPSRIEEALPPPVAPVVRAHKKPARPAADASAPVKVSVVALVDGKLSYGELTVDGVNRGETPTQLELTPGVHRIKVTRPGFQTYDAKLKVVAGQTDRVVVELKR